MNDIELIADGDWCPMCGDPREACKCLSDVEKMSNAELDTELRCHGIDPSDLEKKILERLLQAKTEGHNTKILNEMIRQLSEGRP